MPYDSELPDRIYLPVTSLVSPATMPTSIRSAFEIVHVDPTEATDAPGNPWAAIAGTSSDHAFIRPMTLAHAGVYLDFRHVWLEDDEVTTAPIIRVYGFVPDPVKLEEYLTINNISEDYAETDLVGDWIQLPVDSSTPSYTAELDSEVYLTNGEGDDVWFGSRTRFRREGCVKCFASVTTAAAYAGTGKGLIQVSQWY